MQIYVASLSDYNNGILHGAWFNLEDFEDAEDIQNAIQTRILDTSPTARETGLPAEEWAIHDYDGIYPEGLGEYESLEGLMNLQDCLNQCATEEEEEAFCTWYSEFIDGSTSPGDVNFAAFLDSYCGRYDSEEDYAYAYIEETGMLSELPDYARRYFDYEAFARDMFLDGYTMTEKGFVFRDY